MRRTAVALLCGALVVGRVMAEDPPTASNGDVMAVTHATAVESLKLTGGDQKRIREFLLSMPTGHVAEVECQTVAPGGEAIRHIIRITMRNAAGKADGRELNFVDWYRRAARECTYQDGVQHGVERKFSVEDGVLISETPWDKGRIQGVKRTYHSSGAVANESVYERGEIRGESCTYNPKGGVIRRVRFSRGERDGESVDYWPEKPEQVERVIPYRKGLVHGVAKAFYLGGQLKWQKSFKDNRQQGVETHYAVDGTVEKTLYWRDGNPVSNAAYEQGSPAVLRDGHE